MFRRFREVTRELVDSLQDLRALASSIVQLLEERSSEQLEARVSELERNRALWEAEVEGRFMKAEQERKAARSAEERARHHARKAHDSAGEGDDPELELPEGYLELLGGHDARGAEERLPQVSPRLGSRGKGGRKAAARAFKYFGR